MRIKELLREILVSAWVLRVPSGTLAIIAALMCLASLLTVGRAAAADAQLAARLDDAGSRTLSAVDAHNLGLFTPPVVEATSRLNTVENVLAFSVATDAYNSPLGRGSLAIPARIVSGDLSTSIQITGGRIPQPGEAIVTADAQSRLGLIEPVGSITMSTTGEQFPVVGSFQPIAEIEGLEGILIVADADDALPIVRITVTDTAAIDPTASQFMSIVNTPDPRNLRIENPTSIAELAESITGDLASYSTSILYGVLGIGAAMCGLIVFADALSRRSDLGRRLALGATRSIITIFMVGRTLVPTLAGCALGIMLGLGITYYQGFGAPLSFALGTGILTVIVMGIAALPGALWAAHQDPVTILRTP